jgi:hypothetical protein
MPDNHWTVTSESLEALREVANAIDNTNGDARTPCSEWSVIQVLQHAIGDQLAWAASLGVGTGPSENPFAPSGRLEVSVKELVEPALATAEPHGRESAATREKCPPRSPRAPFRPRSRPPRARSTPRFTRGILQSPSTCPALSPRSSPLNSSPPPAPWSNLSASTALTPPR